MEGWPNVEQHVASEITLLCKLHHHEKTNLLLPLDKVREANRNPHNRLAGVSRPYDLHFEGTSCELVVGGVPCTRDGLTEGTVLIAVAIDRVPLLAFAFEQGHLFLTVQVFDEQDQRVFWVERNELRYCPSPWDICLVGRTLTIREGQGRYLLDIEFSPPNRVAVRRGRFSLNGLEVLVSPNRLYFANQYNVFSNIGVADCDAAFMVGEPIEGARGYHLPAVNRGNPDRDAIRNWMRTFGS
jgi:trigger factor